MNCFIEPPIHFKSPQRMTNTFIFFFSLKAMRAKVWHSRTTSTLFDTKNYALSLEKLFWRMWKRHEQELPPSHLTEPWH